MTTMSKAEAFELFSEAASALAKDLSATECHVFRDDEESFSADIRTVGREAPGEINDYGFTPEVQYAVTLCMTYGHEGVHVMVEASNRNATGEFPLSRVFTSGSDVVEPYCQQIGIQSYV